ncbi:hypothetical protein H5T87_08275 [bacterium]|nr:hypothetical protein [bacterium]
MAKTYDIYLDFSNGDKIKRADKLVAIIPPAWVAGTKVLEDFLPRGEETLQYFPYWEVMLEDSMRKWERGMATGIRDFGDAYYGGPYKGKNSYANLEYDVPLNFLVQFLRTGERWYLDVAEIQARHQADIDIDHFTGRQWKHSPLHTTTEADLGHVFLRGLLLHYLLTGERHSLESAEEIGRWLAPKVERLEGITNERQIGWAIYALCGLYRATGKRDYLIPAEKTSLKLASEQTPTGRFNIRWDNRIAFFNGIAMSALLEVYKLTKREEIYDAILKLAKRTLGFYPEYACRTLDALSFLAERTKDTRFWDLIARTWESSIEFLQNRSSIAAGTFSWQFLHFAGKYRFPFILSEDIQKTAIKPKNWRFLRLKGKKIELLYKGKGNIMVILEGLVEGTIEVYGEKEKLKRKCDLKGEAFFKNVVLPLNEQGKVVLKSTEQAVWEVHYDESIKLTIYEPSFTNLPNIYPRAYCDIRKGAKEIKLILRAQGEGFHKALVYDQRGRLLGAVEKFIDLGDTNSYELVLRVQVPKDTPKENWGLEIYECDILKVEGLSPIIKFTP